MSRSTSRWNSDRLLSMSAMIISFSTLLIFIYQTNLLRRQNYLSIMPYLSVSVTRDAAGHFFEVELENLGVGPAIIESVAMRYRGKLHPLTDYNGDLHRFLVAQAPELDSIQFYSSTIIGKGTAIPANAGFQMISVGGPVEEYQLITRTLQRLLQEGLDYEITYRSIQGERWRIRQDSQGPERLD